MKHTTFIPKTELIIAIRDIVSELKTKLDTVELALTETGGVMPKDSYHFVTRLLKPHSRTERSVYGLIHQAARQAELLSAGSGYFSVLLAVALLERLGRQQDAISETNEVVLMDDHKQRTAELVHAIRVASGCSTPDQIAARLVTICDDRDLSVALQAAVALAGLEGQIRVEDSKQPNYVVELKDGYNFQLQPYSFFLPGGVWDQTQVRVVLMDGLVEKVSELEHLLTKSSETKEPMLFVAQGFSEEVVATLKANQDGGRLNIIPVRLQPDLEGLNILNDLAAAAGCDPLSSLKGELLSCKTYDSIPVVDRVRITSSNVTIQNAKARGRVGQQVQMILEKRAQQHSVEDISDLYDNRIQSLLAHTVVLHLPVMSDVVRTSSKIKIDVCLRTIKTMVSHGSVDLGVVTEGLASNTLWGSVLRETVAKLPSSEMPTLTAAAGIWFVSQMALTLVSTAGFVEMVD